MCFTQQVDIRRAQCSLRFRGVTPTPFMESLLTCAASFNLDLLMFRVYTRTQLSDMKNGNRPSSSRPCWERQTPVSHESRAFVSVSKPARNLESAVGQFATRSQAFITKHEISACLAGNTTWLAEQLLFCYIINRHLSNYKC